MTIFKQVFAASAALQITRKKTASNKQADTKSLSQHFRKHYNNRAGVSSLEFLSRSFSRLTVGHGAETVLSEASRGFRVIIKQLNWICSYAGSELSGLAYQCIYTNRIFKSIEH